MDGILILGFIIFSVLLLIGLCQTNDGGYDIKGSVTYGGLWLAGCVALLIIGAGVLGKSTIEIEYDTVNKMVVESRTTSSVEIVVNNEVQVHEVPTVLEVAQAYCVINIEQEYRFSMFLGNKSMVELEMPCSDVTPEVYSLFVQPIIDDWNK